MIIEGRSPWAPRSRRGSCGQDRHAIGEDRVSHDLGLVERQGVSSSDQGDPGSPHSDREQQGTDQRLDLDELGVREMPRSPFMGRWRIVSMSHWEDEYLDGADGTPLTR